MARPVVHEAPLPGLDDSRSAQLKAELDEKEATIELLRNQLERSGAAMALMESTYQDQAKRSGGVGGGDDADASARRMVQKLNSQLRQKDEKLNQLKAAIKQLEEKLKEVLKKNADEVMRAAAGDTPLTALQSRLAPVLKRAADAAMKAAAAASSAPGSDQGAKARARLSEVLAANEADILAASGEAFAGDGIWKALETELGLAAKKTEDGVLAAAAAAGATGGNAGRELERELKRVLREGAAEAARAASSNSAWRTLEGQLRRVLRKGADDVLRALDAAGGAGGGGGRPVEVRVAEALKRSHAEVLEAAAADSGWKRQVRVFVLSACVLLAGADCFVTACSVPVALTDVVCSIVCMATVAMST